jgi:exodeoxyribonuclease V alpha subunit
MQTLEGILERVTYYNEKTLFMVARLRCDDMLNTFTGNLPRLCVGEKLFLQGEWFQHPDYGKQFRVSSYQVMVPQNLIGIRRFLESGLIKGIGPVTAEKIVRYFGVKTLEVMEREPARLTEVEGIGKKKAAAIAKNMRERQQIVKVMAFLQGFGVSPGYAARIYRKYGDDTTAIVRENPYRLAEEVFGVGFRTADKIAREMGLAFDSPHRIRSALLYLLGQSQEEGHVFLPSTDLTERAIQTLSGEGKSLREEDVAGQLERLAGEGHLVADEFEGEKAVYLAPLFYAERYIAARLHEIGQYQLSLATSRLTVPVTGISDLSPGQQQAVSKAVEAGLLVITGGPGTGKTTTIKSLLNFFLQNGLEVVLAAPTGRAAKRMTEATGVEAKTIHRLLEYVYVEGTGYRFQRDETRPLKAHVVIVDEVSMVDLMLFYSLLKATPPGCKLILVGDMDQLPSVGPGNILRDIIASGAVPVVRLAQIFRQADTSTIVTNAHRVNTGEMPQFNPQADDFYFINESEPQKILEQILDLCSHRLPRFRNKDAIHDIQVLSPMRRHVLGVDNLNLCLQQELNAAARHKPEISAGGVIFRLGDKVMQVRNNYQKDAYNGDIGFITYVNSDDGEIIVRFPDVGGAREVIYDQAEFEELVLSYAVSVHKSQGSEYPVVVLPVVTQHYILLQRNLLYTAITRAKELVVLVGTKKALAIAVRNNKVETRFTKLAARLIEKI